MRVHDVGVHAWIDLGRLREVLLIRQHASRLVAARHLADAAEDRHAGRVDDDRDTACRRHSAGMPDQAEAGDVGARMHCSRRQRLHRFGGGAVERPHRSNGLVGRRGCRAIELDRCSDDAGAERFGEEQHVARLRASVRQDT